MNMLHVAPKTKIVFPDGAPETVAANDGTTPIPVPDGTHATTGTRINAKYVAAQLANGTEVLVPVGVRWEYA